MSDVLSKLKRGSVDSGAEGRVREGWLMKKGQLNTEWKRRWSVHSLLAFTHFPCQSTHSLPSTCASVFAVAEFPLHLLHSMLISAISICRFILETSNQLAQRPP